MKRSFCAYSSLPVGILGQNIITVFPCWNVSSSKCLSKDVFCRPRLMDVSSGKLMNLLREYFQ